MLSKNKWMLVAAVVFTGLALPAFSLAQSETPPGISQQEEIPGKGLHKGWEKGKHKGWDKEKLLKLKEKDPEKFKEIVKQRQEKLRERLEDLKETDPQRYQRIKQKIGQRRQARLEKLRQEDPKKFKEIMQERKKRMQENLEKLKTEDPKKYQRIMERREKLGEYRKDKGMHKGDEKGVRDHGKGIGRGKGQGGIHRHQREGLD